MSKIIFLGSAGTLDVIRSTGRSSGGIIIDADDTQVHIDPGNGALIRAAQFGVDLSKSAIVLVSSPGLVHSNDINSVSEMGDEDKTLLCHKNVLKHEESALTRHHLKRFSKVISEDDKSVHNIRGIQVTMFRTKDEPVAFRIHTTKFILGYIPSIPGAKKFVSEFKDSNILIFGCDDEMDKQLLVEYIEEINPELAVLTGFGKKIMKDDPLEFSRQLKRVLQADKKIAIKTQVLPAKDGMLITPESYNIKVKQKKLERFF